MNLHLQRYKTAHTDALAALIPNANTAQDKELNSKAYLRAGRAQYGLAHYRNAADLFQLGIEFSDDCSSKEDCKTEHLRTAERLKEEERGVYNFASMAAAAKKQMLTRLDHACFVRRTRVAASSASGRGLFAAADIKTGEVVMVEKAFAAAYASDNAGELQMSINVNTNRTCVGTYATLLSVGT